MKPTILFMGTDIHSATILDYLIKENYPIVACVSQPDKPQGRKKVLTPTKVKSLAQEHNIEVYQPISIKNDYQPLLDLDYDILLTVAYGQIIPQVLLDHAKVCNVNVHYSLLPRYRGCSPVQSAIKDGCRETGVSIMEMVKKMDAGQVYVQASCPIAEDDTTTTLFKKLNKLAIELLPDALEKIINDPNSGEIQDEDVVTFTSMITKEDEHITGNKDVITTYNQIRSLLDEPSCYFMVNNERYKILACSYNQESSIVNAISYIANDSIWLGCIDGNIVVNEIQPAGKKPMSVKQFLNGTKLQVGDQLE